MPPINTATRCFYLGCRNKATHAFRVDCVSDGYPIAVGSQAASLYLEYLVCNDHTQPPNELNEPTAQRDFRAIISGAFGAAYLTPDYNRTQIVAVPFTDEGWRDFATQARKVA